MAIKAKTLVPLVLLLSLCLLLTLSCAQQDPRRRLDQCRRECQESTQGEQQLIQCEQQCEDEYRKEMQQREEGRGREDGGWGNKDPEKKLRECRKRCQSQHQDPQSQQEWERRCEKSAQDEVKRDPEEQLQQCRQVSGSKPPAYNNNARADAKNSTKRREISKRSCNNADNSANNNDMASTNNNSARSDAKSSNKRREILKSACNNADNNASSSDMTRASSNSARGYAKTSTRGSREERETTCSSRWCEVIQ